MVEAENECGTGTGDLRGTAGDDKPEGVMEDPGTDSGAGMRVRGWENASCAGRLGVTVRAKGGV